MKFLVAIVMLAALVSAEYQVKTYEDFMKYRDECIEEHKVPAEVVEKYKKLDFPDEPTTHCYMKCFLEKAGLYDETKGFSVDDIHQQVVGADHADHTDATHAAIEKCAKEATSENACERAYQGAKCCMKEKLRLVKKPEGHGDHDHSEHNH